MDTLYKKQLSDTLYNKSYKEIHSRKKSYEVIHYITNAMMRYII